MGMGMGTMSTTKSTSKRKVRRTTMAMCMARVGIITNNEFH